MGYSENEIECNKAIAYLNKLENLAYKGLRGISGLYDKKIKDYDDKTFYRFVNSLNYAVADLLFSVKQLKPIDVKEHAVVKKELKFWETTLCMFEKNDDGSITENIFMRGPILYLIDNCMRHKFDYIRNYLIKRLYSSK